MAAKSGDKPSKQEQQPRKCVLCGGAWDQPPADKNIPYCTKCLYTAAVKLI